MFGNNPIDTERSSLKLEIRDTENDVERLHNHVERLYMLVQALWTVVKAENDLDDSVLAELVKSIDLQDGMLDNRVAPHQTPVCPNCKRTNPSRFSPNCLYCDTAIPHDLFQH